MKVLFCALNSQYVHSNPAVYTLKAACAQYARRYGGEDGSDITIREFSVNDSYASLLFHILAEKADTVAFSCYIWNIDLVRRLCADLKKADPDVCVILGGPEVSFDIGHTGIPEGDRDHVIRGEGEKAMYCLLSRRKDPDFREPEETLPLWPAIYSAESLRAFQNRIVYYESSRGCPFHCAYCLSGEDDRVRCLPLERVAEDLELFRREGTPLVKFTDRTANCDPVRFREILTRIRNMEDCRTTFHFEVGADLFREEDLALLASLPAGRVQLEAGVQSTDSRALASCARKMDTERILRSLAKIRSFGNINLHGDLIAGLPYEGYARFAQSFRTLYALRLHQLQLGFLKLLPGARLGGMLREHGYVFSANPPYEILRNRYLSAEELDRLRAIEDVLERYYNSGRFVTALPMLEACFPDPFALYEKLAAFYLDRGLLFSRISLNRQVDLLTEFAAAEGLGEEFCKALLYDHYASNRQELPPDSLKFLRHGRIRGTGQPEEGEWRQIGGERHCFRYDRKDPVTGLYREVL